jgi:hypothetical protein
MSSTNTSLSFSASLKANRYDPERPECKISSKYGIVAREKGGSFFMERGAERKRLEVNGMG